ncbi:U-box domain [Dillenia turbinata]|uniref:RING-type E3 ubiquitin transferase n=1 Tax=Dillenia turbinata TaxID=194707 RepID=A0AAN8V003_9MAGN
MACHFSASLGGMEISLLKVLLSNISSFLHPSSWDNINSEPFQKYYQKTEEIFKLLKPILEAIVDSEIAANEQLNKEFEDLGQSIDELKELFVNCHPLMSKIYFVMQIDSLIAKVRTSGLEILLLLNSLREQLPDELSSTSLELCIQKIKHVGLEQTSTLIKEAIENPVNGTDPRSEGMTKIANCLELSTNQELLIEAVALDKLKENAEQAEKNEEVKYIDRIILLVTNMHDRLIMLKQSKNCYPVTIPADFCCPLSLELMTDPVIGASGQTYERAFIRKWLDMGLTVCPRTRQTLAHTNLIPNYTVKALIANWCELNNVKLPDPIKTVALNQPSPLLAHESAALRDLPIVSNSRGCQPMLPESTLSMSLPGKKLLSASGSHQEGNSSAHLRSSSDVTLSGVAGNGHGLDIGKLSLSSDDRSPPNVDESSESGGQPSTSPSRKVFPFAAGVDEQSSHSHNRTTSASSATSADFSQGTPGDENEVTCASNNPTAYNSDASGEMTSEPQATPTSTTLQREPEFPVRLVGSRNQSIWRRPGDRLGIARIVSSTSMETRPDLSGVEAEVRRLMVDLKSTSVDTQRDATHELRLLAKNNMDNRIVIANCGAISLLVNLLCSTDERIQGDAVTALLNLSINDNNKIAIANAEAIEPLIHVLQTGSPEAKENSAATLFSLSVIEDNKVRIGRSGAIKPLVELLGNGTPRGKKDAATALFNLSIFHENKARIVQASAVRYLVELMDPAAGMVDKAVAVLANLATIHEGRVAIGNEGGIPVLVEAVELGSARGKENAAAALLQLCTNSSRFCTMVLQEGAVPPLVALSQSGTPRAKEKAQALLTYFRSQRHGSAGRG